jgi:penicillin amidase
VFHLVQTKPGGWFRNWDEMLASALAEAIAEAKRQFGKSPAKWDWEAENRVVAAHPVASTVKWIAPYFNVGPVGVSGSSQSVKQAGGRIMPSLRFVADTADWDRSQLILPTGQSGHLFSGFSRHYKDEWEDYAVGKARPFLFVNVPADSTLTLAPMK